MEKAVTVKKPVGKATPKVLEKYKRYKDLYKFYKLKKEIGLNFTSSDEAKLAKYKAKMEKARKLAAPELIKLQRAKRAAVGKGKKRGIGSNLMKATKK